jgi:hypothetical protein
MNKLIIFYQPKILKQMVVNHGLKFELCLHSIYHLKLKFHVWVSLIEGEFGFTRLIL